MRKHLYLFCVLALALKACSENGLTPQVPVTTSHLKAVEAAGPAKSDSLYLSEFVSYELLYDKGHFAELKSLRPYVPADHMLYTYTQDDLNGDGLRDYLLVVSPNNGDSQKEGMILLYTGQADNSLRLQSQNTTIFSSYFNSLEIEARPEAKGFLMYLGISGAGWHKIMTDATLFFTFDQAAKDWLLHSHCVLVTVSGANELKDEHGNAVLDEDGAVMQDTTKVEEELFLSPVTQYPCSSYETQADFGILRFSQFDFETVFYD